MKRLSVLLAVALLVGPAGLSGADRLDKRTMTIINYHDTDIVRNSGAADSLHRRAIIANSKLWRIDLYRGGLQIGGTIRNGHELWVFDLPTRSTQRSPDSLGDVPMSLLLLPEAPELRDLEMGSEREFFDCHNTGRLADEKIDTILCEVHQFDTATASVKMWYSVRLARPMQFWVKTAQNEFKVLYDSYRPKYPFDTTAFRVPKEATSPQEPVPPVIEEDSLARPGSSSPW